jgi:hypothetical protein
MQEPMQVLTSVLFLVEKKFKNIVFYQWLGLSRQK